MLKILVTKSTSIKHYKPLPRRRHTQPMRASNVPDSHLLVYSRVGMVGIPLLSLEMQTSPVKIIQLVHSARLIICHSIISRNCYFLVKSSNSTFTSFQDVVIHYSSLSNFQRTVVSIFLIELAPSPRNIYVFNINIYCVLVDLLPSLPCHC